MPNGLIVVGLDGSESSKEALRWAARQARLTNAALRAVIAWHLPTNYGWPVPPYPELDFEADARKILDQAIDEALGPDRPDDLDTKVIEGHPAAVLVGAAADADLLVVGSRGHGAFAGMLLGSVSEHCVHQATCPVLVERGGSAGEATP